VISEDLDEIFALADRIAVMHHGRLETRATRAWTLAELGLAMAERPGDGRHRREARPARSAAHALERPPPRTSLEPREAAVPPRHAGAGAGHAVPSCSRSLLRAVAWAGAPVGKAYALLLEGGFGSRFALTETLTRATPLILTGLAAAVAFRARLYNIGAEGQLYAGALAAVAVGGLHGGSGFACRCLAAVPADDGRRMLAGALLLLGPALLKSRWASTRW
jgi:hypothetical protein